MSELLIYLGKGGLCLGLLLLFFVIFLQKETFLKLNRWILLANIVLALALPLLEVPAWFSNFEVVKIESSEKKPIPLDAASPLIIENITPAVEPTTRASLNWKAIFLAIYLIGFLIFMLRFLVQIFSILLLILSSEREKKENILFVYPGKILAPFSFFSFLFIDKTAYDSPALEQIIAHEKVHIRQRHSWDIFFSELLIIIQWFNPFAWWLRKLIETNLEYLVDQHLLENGTDQKTYQYNLLKIAVPNFPYSLATNYNSSLLKKRIVMMQQKKSSTANSWKYFLLLPVMLLIWFAFGNPNSGNQKAPFISIITADANELDLRKTQEAYREVGGRLIINELTFDENDRLFSLNITSISDEIGECTSSMDGFQPYSYLIFERNTASISERNFAPTLGCGSALSSTDFTMLRNPKNWDFIFIDGQRPTQEKIDQLKKNTEEWRVVTKKKLKNTNHKTVGTTTYIDLTEEKKAIIKDEIAAAKTTTIYYLDGLKTDKTIDDFDYKNIRSVKLNEKWMNYYDAQGELLESLIDTLEVRIVGQ